ncbi:hypothetical protein [Chitinophaga costaii]|uniref:hypothetical protein n=1 Tax=Chitinophaga costaii TaxID=1335309 RepID=UPI000F508E22|nr:hypothetical protein [Chitinophaga costaii]
MSVLSQKQDLYGIKAATPTDRYFAILTLVVSAPGLDAVAPVIGKFGASKTTVEKAVSVGFGANAVGTGTGFLNDAGAFDKFKE